MAAILPEAQTTPATGDRNITASAWEIVTNPPTEEDPATHATHTPQGAKAPHPTAPATLITQATVAVAAATAAAALTNSTTLKTKTVTRLIHPQKELRSSSRYQLLTLLPKGRFSRYSTATRHPP